VIDLHLHNTASDGRSTPADLAREAAAAGVRVLAVTDHDTTAAVADVSAAAGPLGLTLVPAIEMTAVEHGRDVHVLGYFLDPDDRELGAFLDTQREARRERVARIVERLRALGVVVDAGAIADAGRAAGRAVGRPLIAAALVSAGVARDIADAFDRYLGEGRPAFVERRGHPVADVIDRIRRAGGVASIAHPGKARMDAAIPSFAAAGLGAIEVYHPDHTPADVERYRTMAEALGLAITGGSDYHGPGSGRAHALGVVSLPADAFADLAARAGQHSPR
jgi:predicted metal-dependent phosphoesterase TrpH